VVSKGACCYYVTFVDNCTCWTHIDLLCDKSKTFTSYKDFDTGCETILGACIKVFYSDRGGEYIRKEFIVHLKEHGTAQKLTTHHTPQHNGIAECCNHTIVEHI
jgi:transposase InsO family protein